jgi:hypothetical protein
MFKPRMPFGEVRNFKRTETAAKPTPGEPIAPQLVVQLLCAMKDLQWGRVKAGA